MIEVTLPIPPSANRLHFNVRGAGRVKTDQYKAWINAAGLLVNAQRVPSVRGRIAVTLAIPRNRRRDLDNHVKPLLDLLRRMDVIDDDRNVDRLTVAYADRDDVLVQLEAMDA